MALVLLTCLVFVWSFVSLAFTLALSIRQTPQLSLLRLSTSSPLSSSLWSAPRDNASEEHRLLQSGGSTTSAPQHHGKARPQASLLATAAAATVAAASVLLSASTSSALAAESDVQRRSESFLDDPTLQKAEINIQSDDFWYPPFLLGRWNTSLIFDSAKFISNVPLETLARAGLPGFAKYSVFFLPEMGQDIPSTTLRYVSLDGHPREDHSHNLRSLVQACSPGTVVDAAPYSFQKAPNWLRSPANKWHIDYHDEEGKGTVDLLTQKRNLKIFAGTVESAEFFRQTHRRDGGKAVVTDFCINWRLSVPASLRDEFITVEDLRKSETVLGALDVYVYLQPSSDFYLVRPRQPAGVYTYNVTMRRPLGWNDEAARAETQSVTYPFLWRDAGPQELDQFFGK